MESNAQLRGRTIDACAAARSQGRPESNQSHLIPIKRCKKTPRLRSNQTKHPQVLPAESVFSFQAAGDLSSARSNLVG
jgi:hypothetical protein